VRCQPGHGVFERSIAVVYIFVCILVGVVISRPLLPDTL